MNPDANIRETTALYRQETLSSADVARLAELREAYGAWRASGGFAASSELLRDMAAAYDARVSS